jgi:TP901 family phage tail tape measure protein
MRDIKLTIKIITDEAKNKLAELKKQMENLSEPKQSAGGFAQSIAEGFSRARSAAQSAYEVARQMVASLDMAGRRQSMEYEQAQRALREARREAEAFERALERAEPRGMVDRLKEMNGALRVGLIALGTQAGFDTFVKSFMELDTATQRIRTLGGAAEELAPRLKQMAVEMSRSVPIAANEMQNAMYEALSAGVEPSEQAMKKFMDVAVKLSVGGVETIGNSVNVLSSVLNAYGASVDEAARYSDILFNTVNLGKTTIPELSASLSQVVPAAASAEVGFDAVGAALALMTANGIPTSQAATKLNALLTEMKKPGQDFAEVMKAAGVSLESLREEGLVETLVRLRGAMEQLGVQAGQVMGSVESAAAFDTLTKDVERFRETFEGVAGVTGSTEAAFERMQESVQVRLQQMIAQLQATFVELANVFMPLVEGVLGGVQTAIKLISQAFGGQFAPVMKSATIAVLAYVAAQKMASREMITTAVNSIKTLIASLFAKTTATTAATAATNALKAAWATNPLGMVLAGVALAVGAIMTLRDALSESIEEKKQAVEAEKSYLEEQKKTLENDLKQAEAKRTLIDQYVQLAEKSKRTADEQRKFEALQKQIEKNYPGLIDKTASFSDNLGKLKAESAETANYIGKLETQLSELDRRVAESNRKLLYIEANKIRADIAKVFDDATSNWLGAMDANASAMEYKMNQMFDKIYSAKTVDELRARLQDLTEYIEAWKPEGQEQQDAKYKMLKMVQEFGRLRQQAMTFWDEYEKEKAEETAEEVVKTEKKKTEEVRKETDERIRKKIEELQAARKSAESAAEAAEAEAEAERARRGRSRSLAEELEYEQKRLRIIAEHLDKAKKIEVQNEKERETVAKFVEGLESELQQRTSKVNLLNAKIEWKDKEKAMKAIEDDIKQLEGEIKIAYEREDFEAANRAIDEILEKNKQLQEALQLHLQVETDDEARQEIIGKIEQLQKDADARKIEIGVNLQKLAITKITDPIEYEYRKALLEADLTYRRELEMAEDNIARKLIAQEKYWQERQRLEHKYIRESLRLENRLRSAMEEASRVLLEQLTAGLDVVQAKISGLEEQLSSFGKEDKDKYKDEERKLSDSLQKREVTLREYAARMDEIDEQKRKSGERASREELRIRLATARALAAAAGQLEASNLAAIAAIQRQIATNMQRLESEGKNIADNLSELFAGTGENISKLLEGTAGVAAATFGAMLAAGVEVGEAFRKAILGTLIKTAQQAILTYIPQIYAAFMGWMGPFGLAAATAAIAMVYGALEYARSAIGLRSGAVDLQGPGTETSDSIPARLSRGESVITAKATRANKELLEWINRTGRPAVEYFIAKKDVNFYNTHNDALTLEIRALRQEIAQLPMKRTIASRVEVGIDVNDRELIRRIAIEREARLRRL